jgi:hypothetical protein
VVVVVVVVCRLGSFRAATSEPNADLVRPAVGLGWKILGSNINSNTDNNVGLLSVLKSSEKVGPKREEVLGKWPEPRNLLPVLA